MQRQTHLQFHVNFVKIMDMRQKGALILELVLAGLGPAMVIFIHTLCAREAVHAHLPYDNLVERSVAMRQGQIMRMALAVDGQLYQTG